MSETNYIKQVVVPAHLLEQLKAKLTKIVKKARRYNSDSSIDFTVGLPRMERKSVFREIETGEISSVQNEYMVEVVDVTFSSPIPSIQGWSCVSCVTVVDGMSLFTNAVDGIQIPDRYKSLGHVCEHCNAQRRRNDTFIVTNGQQFKQVGRNCLADFLGTTSIQEFVFNSTTVLRYVEESFSEFGIGNYRDQRVFDLTNILELAAVEIRKSGQFVSRSKAYNEGGHATADSVITMASMCQEAQTTSIDITGEDRQLAADTLAFVRGMTDEYIATKEATFQPFLKNLRTIASVDRVLDRSVGLVCAAIPTYKRHMVDAERQLRKDNAGEAPEGRCEIRGKVVSFKTYDSAFGTVQKFLIELENGSKVFMTVPSSLEWVDKGDVVKLTATFERKERTFAVGKRPSKAVVVTKANQPAVAQ